MSSRCLSPGCARDAEADAPVALCALHAVEVHDWVAGGSGVTDVLPAPCRACGSRLGVRYPSGWLCAVCEWRLGDIPDGDEPVRVDVVYYARRGERVKIGTSANPRQRLGSLGVDELLALEPGDRLVEHRRHAQFAALRLGTGEWFGAGPALLEHIAELRAGVDDPWTQHTQWIARAIARRG